MRGILTAFVLILSVQVYAQADNEIQVYASPTISHNWTIFELHTNYNYKGSKYGSKEAKWLNETLEITHGFAKDFEIGFYTFTAVSPGGRFQYLGNQVRPRVTVPSSWNWKIGASLSVEFGFFRPNDTTSFFWQGEIRPIIDYTLWEKLYISLNPNFDFVVTGKDQGAGFAPQMKVVYTFNKKIGIGFEIYDDWGPYRADIYSDEEKLMGPMIDLYIHPMWELNGGLLFGLSDGSNQRVIKLLLGRRIKKKGY